MAESMTDVEYIAEGGVAGPHCGNKNTAVLEQPKLGDDAGTGQNECHDCGKTWDTHWRLSGWAAHREDETPEAKALDMIKLIAKFTKDGEKLDGEDFILENDDAVAAFHDMIDEARAIVGPE